MFLTIVTHIIAASIGVMVGAEIMHRQHVKLFNQYDKLLDDYSATTEEAISALRHSHTYIKRQQAPQVIVAQRGTSNLM